MGALLDQPDHPAHVVGGQPVQWHAVERRHAGVDGQEAHQDVGQRRLAGTALPDQRHPASRGEVEIHAAQDGPVGAGVARPHRAQGERVWPGHLAGKWKRGVGLLDRRRGVAGGEHPAGRRARTLQRLGRRRQRGHQLEGGQRDEREHGQQRTVEVPAVGGAHPEGQRAPAGETGQRRGETETDAGGARPLARRGAQATIRRGDPLHLLAGPAHDRQLGRSLNQVDHRRVELAPG